MGQLNKKNVFLKKIKQYLCPAGSGVYRVHSSFDLSHKLWEAMYFSTQEKEVQKVWQKKLKELFKTNSKAVLVGVCSDSGAGIIRGSNWGPSEIRQMLLEERDQFTNDYFDIGDIRVIPHLLHDKYLNTVTLKSCREFLYKDSNLKLPVSPLSIAEDFALEFYRNFSQKGLIALGGDHSISFPFVKAFLKHKKGAKSKKAIIHFDAHSDLLSDRMGIDINFSSWAYNILDHLESPQHLIQLGIRSSHKSKRAIETQLKVKQFWANEIHSFGPSKISDLLIKHLNKLEVTELYISFDVDVLDIEYCSATGTPEKNGLNPSDAVTIIQNLAKNFSISAGDIVEVAPFVSHPFKQLEGHVEPLNTLLSAQSICSLLIQEISRDK